MKLKMDRTLSRQFVAAVAVAGVWVVTLIVLGGWAASEIDGRAIERQTLRAQSVLDELRDRLPKEQDSSAVWNEAVLAVRANDGGWMAENLVEWLGGYYGHDRIYVLNPNDQVVRAALDGETADASAFSRDADIIVPIVADLRQDMAEATQGASDSTELVLGMGKLDFVRFADDRIGLVSVRPILPETDAVTQAPGEEFLHVSVEMLDQALLEQLGTKFGLADLSASPSPAAGLASIPIAQIPGGGAGWLSWEPDRPATQFIKKTAPALLVALFFGGACFTFLLLRLRRTTRELQTSEAHARHLAFHDQLTGVPNRALFEDRLERALMAGRRGQECTVLHYLDLDHFKHINDSLGHPSGDELVRQVAGRLLSVVRETDTVARIGGDEFAIIQTDANGEADANMLCERILLAIDHPFDLNGEEAHVGLSIGAALQTQSECSPADLMRQADIALYEAKAAGKGRHRIFAGEMDDLVKRRRLIEKDLRQAIELRQGLGLVFQPIFEAGSGLVVGAEALARWSHPVHGVVPPETFITLAEERGLIERLGVWVLREACQFAHHNDLAWIAVNMSPVQLNDPNLPKKIDAILEETGLGSHRLQIEVTEGVLLQDSPAVRQTICDLRARGITIALDDFGTGYASISYLLKYGVDKLKIDRSFVSKLDSDGEVLRIVGAIIDLARAMGMTVTAEGVETQSQYELLKRMECSEIQGFLLSRPLSAAKMASVYGFARTASDFPHVSKA